MDVPKSFRSEYGIEEKTDQLMEEVKTLPKENFDAELKELIDEYYKVYELKNPEKIESLINKLLKEYDYKPIHNPKLKLCKYWTKQTLSNKHWVYIQAEEYASRHYFAEVKENKLEEFCKSFEIEERKNFHRKDLTSFFTGAIPTFIGAGYKLYNYLNPFGYSSTSTPMEVILCALVVLTAGFAAAVTGLVTYEVIHYANQISMKRCYDRFIDSEIEVVRETFK